MERQDYGNTSTTSSPLASSSRQTNDQEPFYFPDEILAIIFHHLLTSIQNDYDKKINDLQQLVFRGSDKWLRLNIAKEKIKAYSLFIRLRLVCRQFNNVIYNEEGDTDKLILYRLSNILYKL